MKMSDELYSRLFEEFDTLPKKATVRSEYVKCGNIDCNKLHGPYLYGYWKQDRKLKKMYIGKSYEEYYARITNMVIQKLIGERITHTQLKKGMFVRQQSQKGIKTAMEYWKKIKEEKVSVDWAYKKVNESIEQWRIVRIFNVAERLGNIPDTPEEAIGIVISEMKSKGLEADTIEQIDSYLNSEFR